MSEKEMCVETSKLPSEPQAFCGLQQTLHAAAKFGTLKPAKSRNCPHHVKKLAGRPESVWEGRWGRVIKFPKILSDFLLHGS